MVHMLVQLATAQPALVCLVSSSKGPVCDYTMDTSADKDTADIFFPQTLLYIEENLSTSRKGTARYIQHNGMNRFSHTQKSHNRY